jgi:hypothetical protein
MVTDVDVAGKHSVTINAARKIVAKGANEVVCFDWSLMVFLFLAALMDSLYLKISFRQIHPSLEIMQ